MKPFLVVAFSNPAKIARKPPLDTENKSELFKGHQNSRKSGTQPAGKTTSQTRLKRAKKEGHRAVEHRQEQPPRREGTPRPQQVTSNWHQQTAHSHGRFSGAHGTHSMTSLLVASPAASPAASPTASTAVGLQKVYSDFTSTICMHFKRYLEFNLITNAPSVWHVGYIRSSLRRSHRSFSRSCTICTSFPRS